MRHGDTKFNTGDPATDRAKGKLDLPLVERGHAKAAADAQKLKAFAVEEVHHSPLKRSAQTAAHVTHTTGAKAVADPGLDPWDIGYLGGQLRKDVQDRVDYYIAHKNRPVPDGEPYGDFWKRITDAFAALMQRAADVEGVLVVVGHSDGIEAVTSWLDGTVPGAQTATNGVDPGAILIFEKKGRSWQWKMWSGSQSKEKDEE